MKARLLGLADVTDADSVRWRELAAMAIEPNAYLDPRFVLPARDWSGAADRMQLAVAEHGDRWVGLLAFEAWRPRRKLPFRLASTATPFLSMNAERYHPLLAPEDPGEAFAAILACIIQEAGADVIDINAVPADGHLFAAVDQGAASAGLVLRDRARFATPVAMANPDYLTKVGTARELIESALAGTTYGGKIRRNVRHLERDHGAAVEIVEAGPELGVADEFVAFQAAGWKGDKEMGGGALSLEPAHEAWFRAVVDGFQRASDLSATRLTCNGQTVSLTLQLRSGGAWFGFLDAFAPTFAKYSPGALGRIGAWRAVLSDPAALFADPGVDASGDAVARAFPDRREAASVRLMRGGPRGRLANTSIADGPAF